MGDAGEKQMMRNLKRITGMWLCILALAAGVGCSGGKETPPDKAGVRPPVAVETITAQVADLDENIEVVGSLSPKFSADVKSEIPGKIAQVYVAEWVRVAKGAPLTRLDTTELDLQVQRAQAAVEVARANALQTEVGRNRTDREYDRLLKLKEAGLVTQQSLDDGLTERDAAEARVSAARAQIKAAEEEIRQAQTRLAKAVIRSPIDGVVSERSVNVGDVPADKLLFKIIDNRLLNLTVTVPSTEMGSMRLGQSLTFSTTAIPDKTFTGKVMFINPAVNETDRSVKVIAEVPNVPEQLKAGLFVKGKIITGARKAVLQVPRAALTAWDVASRKGEVYVIQGEKAIKRPIETGVLSGDFIEVRSGLSKGEIIVTRGGFNLKDGDRVTLSNKAGR
jgi:membrane fusion protein, multidrug efflux system